jgi:hypothetical protein
MLGNSLRRIGFPQLGFDAKDFPHGAGRLSAIHIHQLLKLG